MNERMIVWVIIVALMVIAFIVRAVGKCGHSIGLQKHKQVLEIGKERELLYCPGDRYDYDDDL